MNIKNKKFVFTGALITMSRKQAQALVLSLGGKIQKSISKSTTVLVIGNFQGDLLTGRISSKKIEAAQKRNEKKHFITIIDDKKFLSLIIEDLNLLHRNL